MRISRHFVMLWVLIICKMALHAGGKDYPVQAVPFTDVRITDNFWTPRLETNRLVTIPYAFKKCEETGRIDNFAIAGGLKQGKFCGIHFNDSDVFKVIEGASYSLTIHPDADLDHYVDGVIAKIAAAQLKDGYLYTARELMGPDYTPPGGKERWAENEDSHELYNAGHLYEAAVAHYQATGKRSLLEVAIRNADLICNVFGPGKRHEVPCHQEIEIGLCKLYRLTGDEKYLRMAKFFLDERGNAAGHKLMGEYAQDHKPVLQQEKAVGHAVRAAYMFSGMADVAALTGDASYIEAIDMLWQDVVGTKMYVTGGIGATGGNEGFGEDYVLPNLSAYCETCASIANAMWNERMFLLHGDAKYIDVLERVIYNGFLSGISMKGDRFFYPNPLESIHGRERSPWFDCACCPSNIVRFVPSIPGYIYAHRDNTLYVNLFIGGGTSVKLKSTVVNISQHTDYPWDGKVVIGVNPEIAAEFSLCVRIPEWQGNRPLPTDLYSYADKQEAVPVLTVNGRQVPVATEKGYATIRRTWQKGDRVELLLNMSVRRVTANEKVVDDRGRIALERGPLVFCAEGVDHKGGWVVNLMLPDTATLTSEFRKDLLGGVVVARSKVVPIRRKLDGTIASDGPEPFTAIPYYAWSHRDPGQMTVWLAGEMSAARAYPAPTVAYSSHLTVSGGTGKEAINDQFEPGKSNDHSVPYFHWWPNKGTTEWVQYDFQTRTRVSKIAVYWFDDTGIGECRVPKSWQVLYKDGEQWKPLPDPDAYGVQRDTYNTTTFTPVVTDGLRLQAQLQPDFSAGIHEWRVE